MSEKDKKKCKKCGKRPAAEGDVLCKPCRYDETLGQIKVF